jgi:hypothetical protein
MNCKLCGWENHPHLSMVDCINAYRAYTADLHGLLPKGELVTLATIDRNSTVRIWIDGPITQSGLERIKQYMSFMQEAYGPDPEPIVADPEGEANG